MRAFILAIFLSASSAVFAIEIRVWVNDMELDKLSDSEINEKIENNELMLHPCGLVQMKEVLALLPPDSVDVVDGVESVYEFGESGVVVNQWSIPVDSEVFGVEGADIFVGWQEAIALKIARTGEITESEQSYVEHELVKCPNAAKDIFVDSDYIVCATHKDLQTGDKRLLSYEGICM